MSKQVRRVLVVDDDEQVLATIRRTLSDAGYQVETAVDGRAALELAMRWLPDLLLTDILMPEQEGIETILEARRRWPEMAIVAMSGGGVVGRGISFLEQAQRLGADAGIPKPFRRLELLGVLHEVLEREPGTRSCFPASGGSGAATATAPPLTRFRK